MSERRDDVSDSDQSSPKQQGSDEKTSVHQKPGDAAGEDTVVRKAAARNENSTILREPGTTSSDSATILREPRERRQPLDDGATVIRKESAADSDDATAIRDPVVPAGDNDAEATVIRAEGNQDDDATVMNPDADDDAHRAG